MKAGHFIAVGAVGAGVIALATANAHSPGAKAADVSTSRVTVTVPAASATARTCAAFRTWNSHRTTAHLDAMMADSFAAPWKYIGEDASGLYSDVRGGSAKYIKSDIRYFNEDCAGK